jgi:hypothetical protein
MATNALAMTKLKNRILAIDPTLVVELRNIRVNGVLFGCSGFITDPATNRIVYVNTDHNHGTRWNQPYYRTAKSTRDYTGGQNHFTTYDKLAALAVALVKGF